MLLCCRWWLLAPVLAIVIHAQCITDGIGWTVWRLQIISSPLTCVIKRTRRLPMPSRLYIHNIQHIYYATILTNGHQHRQCWRIYDRFICTWASLRDTFGDFRPATGASNDGSTMRNQLIYCVILNDFYIVFIAGTLRFMSQTVLLFLVRIMKAVSVATRGRHSRTWRIRRKSI